MDEKELKKAVSAWRKAKVIVRSDSFRIEGKVATYPTALRCVEGCQEALEWKNSGGESPSCVVRCPKFRDAAALQRHRYSWRAHRADDCSLAATGGLERAACCCNVARGPCRWLRERSGFTAMAASRRCAWALIRG